MPGSQSTPDHSSTCADAPLYIAFHVSELAKGFYNSAIILQRHHAVSTLHI
jgi:hypothetical protein